VADVLFGDYKPTGKLPRNWPRDISQLAGNSIDMANPLFARGFGLTYK
jgi:beta-glucosidase